MAQAAEEGTLLGREEQLQRQLGVSRPTFRQIARLLEQEQLIAIKRGAKGGVFARQPSIEAVAHVAFIYLKGQNAKVPDIVQASGMLTRDTIRLATKCQDDALRSKLKEFMESEQNKGDSLEDEHSHKLYESLFMNILSSMCGNPVIKLFFSILHQIGYSLTEETVFHGEPERRLLVRETRIRIAQAILADDGELASLLWHRRSQMVTDWLSED